MRYSRPVDGQGFVAVPKIVREVTNAEIGDTVEVEVSYQGKCFFEIRKIHPTGRLYLHKKLRDELGIKEGDVVTLDIKNVVKKEKEENNPRKKEMI